MCYGEKLWWKAKYLIYITIRPKIWFAETYEYEVLPNTHFMIAMNNECSNHTSFSVGINELLSSSPQWLRTRYQDIIITCSAEPQ